jgi:regulator of RNase E activity RraA
MLFIIGSCPRSPVQQRNAAVINIPIRIGNATVMPGDVVLSD